LTVCLLSQRNLLSCHTKVDELLTRLLSVPYKRTVLYTSYFVNSLKTVKVRVKVNFRTVGLNANQFVLASPSRLTTRDFFNWTLAVVLM
jgi:hypothetical protein